MVEKILSRSVRLMFASGVVMGAGMLAQPAFAQEATQRIEITGSSIKRIAAETALPVQTLSKAAIEQTGATTAADLIASLPSMQGFTTSSASVNGGGGGTQTASIHGVGENYTLVLINGRRVAPFNTGSAVNLASIPLSAVERVEILTDGASALYGSDAIAGVINFILKKNQKDFNIEFTYSTPQESSKGKTTNFAISKGFGDLNTDGYNLLLAFSRDEQVELNASDRSFTKLGGVTPFNEGGKPYMMNMLSRNSVPANVFATAWAAGVTNTTGSGVNPYKVLSGNCPAENTYAGGNRCNFNYGAVVQLMPELKRDNYLVSYNLNINDNLKFFVEGMATNFTNTARYAPPAQPLSVNLTSKLFKESIAPAYAKLGYDPTKITKMTMNLRLLDAGGRTDEWKTNTTHLATGFEGSFSGWDYAASYIFSENKATDTPVAGYTSSIKLNDLINDNKYNPFLAPTAATKAALAPAVLHSVLDETTSQINVLSLRGSGEVFKLAGGGASVGLGLDVTKQSYIDNPSIMAQGSTHAYPDRDTNIGGGAGAVPVDASRTSWGTFAELFMPITKSFDLTAAARYDSFDAVQNKKLFKLDQYNDLIPAGSGAQGNKQSAATYKLAAAFRPTDTLLLRASYGTGFKVPTMLNITQPFSYAGSSNAFSFPNLPANHPLADLNGGEQEYDLLQQGNPNLKPEKSTQGTLGFRLEALSNLSLGFDLWNISIKDQIKTVSQKNLFTKPDKYSNTYYRFFQPIQKEDVFAVLQQPFNLAKADYQGIDWDHTYRINSSYGKIAFNWTGTYMLKADLTSAAGEPVEKTVGKFDSYNNVTFRLISKLTASWKPSDRYSHSVTLGYHSSYRDQPISADLDGTVAVRNADGSAGDAVDMNRTVKAYYTVDLQSKVNFSKNLTITGGIKNLFNQDPPFSDRNAGGGNQLGFDGRYTDPLGRQFYVVANLKF
ncbi:TonB-dependent receptor plug domain-containing protein [Undibacterium flavidum]|uniref:TonB-dependent receptor n=1 Tax=Undibacterium flavidum TaxID=2762297 RepID=A0ABR6YAZ9_9BURK|nr:TonB-dependent receptor [Undibacterium flavidum]MBC3873828.1 TonB-dependent receptor [Undibacterium flavidum]